MRPDAKNNLKKVAAEVLKNPLATGSEIARNTGLSEGCVSGKLKKVEDIARTSSIIEIEETDLDIVKKAQGILNTSLDGYVGQQLAPQDAKHVSSIAEASQKRYSILSGSVTDKEGGLIAPETKEAMDKLLDDIL